MDQNLETAIDEVGRDKVFARARTYGYGPNSLVEKWVWWGIVRELKEGKPAQIAAPERLDESIFGFRLV